MISMHLRAYMTKGLSVKPVKVKLSHTFHEKITSTKVQFSRGLNFKVDTIVREHNLTCGTSPMKTDHSAYSDMNSKTLCQQTFR